MTFPDTSPSTPQPRSQGEMAGRVWSMVGQVVRKSADRCSRHQGNEDCGRGRQGRAQSGLQFEPTPIGISQEAAEKWQVESGAWLARWCESRPIVGAVAEETKIAVEGVKGELNEAFKLSPPPRESAKRPRRNGRSSLHPH
ncbi:hypothetical protein B0H10DRAFT_1952966 [Mycena sp. CBHHK59/15]|nr:hypothetical protein B0H10DRAFT_1952966 [Mycena sp. CBHHK59/15]